MPCFPLRREGEGGAGVTLLLPFRLWDTRSSTHPQDQFVFLWQARPSTGNNNLQSGPHCESQTKKNKYQPLAHRFTQIRNRHQFIWQSLPDPSVPYVTMVTRGCCGGLLGSAQHSGFSLLGLGCAQLLPLLPDEKNKIWRTFHSTF